MYKICIQCFFILLFIKYLQQENDQMTLQLAKARHKIKRLRIERV